MISQCEEVQLDNIFLRSQSSVHTVILLNTRRLTLLADSLAFPRPATVVIGNIGQISFR